jgi:O-antigen ligase
MTAAHFPSLTPAIRGARWPIVAMLLASIAIGVAVPLGLTLVVAAPFGLGVAAYAWWRFPGASLAFYLFLPFYKAALGPLSPVDLTPLLALGAAAQVVAWVHSREPYGGSRVGLILWAALAVIVLAGVIIASDQSIAVGRAAYWWLLVLLPSLAAIRIAANPARLAQFLTAGFAVGCGIVILGLPSAFGIARLSVIGENTLQTGAITLMTGVMAVFWVTRIGPAWTRIPAVAITVVGVLESVATGSRGPLLAFLVVALYAVLNRFVSRHRVTRRDVGLTLAGVGGVAVLALAVSRLPEQSISRLLLIGGVFGPGGGGTSVEARVDLFSLATQMFVSSPLFGHGTGSFAAYTSTIPGLEAFAFPHNDLLQMAAEFGMVGALTFVGLTAVALFRGLPATPAWTTTRLVFVFMLVLAMTSGDIYGDRLLWGLATLLVAAPVPARNPTPSLRQARWGRLRAPRRP